MTRISPSPPPTRGLTLLELMLALVLMTVIVGATWSLLGVFRDRLETSQRQTEQWQLIRSLQQTLASDLRSCQIPRVADLAGATETPLAAGTPGTQGIESDDGAAAAPVIGTDPPARDTPQAGRARSPDPFALPPPTLPADATPSLDPLTDRPNATLASGADAVIRGAWLEPDSFLLGTSQAMMFDVIPPAPPEGPRPPQEEAPLDQATIPDTVRRIVYAFHDPATALRTDRPPGLLRCELTMRQLTLLRQLGTMDADLLTLLRPELDAPAAELSQGAGSPGNPPAAPGSRVDPAAARLPRESTAPLSAAPQPDLQLGEQLDYIPELASFALRYFDGITWLTEWDSRRQARLPVAVELRFQLATEIRPSSTAEAEVPGEFGDALETSQSSPGPLAVPNAPSLDLEPVDDRLRSAQSRPPDDHRFVIFIGPPPTRSAIPPDAERLDDPSSEWEATP